MSESLQIIIEPSELQARLAAAHNDYYSSTTEVSETTVQSLPNTTTTVEGTTTTNGYEETSVPTSSTSVSLPTSSTTRPRQSTTIKPEGNTSAPETSTNDVTTSFVSTTGRIATSSTVEQQPSTPIEGQLPPTGAGETFVVGMAIAVASLGFFARRAANRGRHNDNN